MILQFGRRNTISQVFLLEIDPRGIAFTLSTDGLNPYSHNHVSYSMRPIVRTVFYLGSMLLAFKHYTCRNSAWKCMDHLPQNVKIRMKRFWLFASISRSAHSREGHATPAHNCRDCADRSHELGQLCLPARTLQGDSPLLRSPR